MLVKAFVWDVVICSASEVIARHPRSYGREDMVFNPLHYLALLEQKTNALDQAAPLAGWRLATRNRRRYGGYAVHAGILVMGIAIAVSATLSTDTSATLAPGESVTVGDYTVTYDRLVVEPLAADPRVIESRAEIRTGDAVMATALRDYPNSQTPIATPVVRTSLGDDLYVTLMAADPASQSVTLRIFVNPLVVWIWLGGAIVLLGAAFAIWPDRRRLAVARPAPAPAPVERPLPVAEQELG